MPIQLSGHFGKSGHISVNLLISDYHASKDQEPTADSSPPSAPSMELLSFHPETALFPNLSVNPHACL
jgi:hypothetical protein